MKKLYLERLREGILLFDSAMGTMLYEKGIFINRCFEEINLTSPAMVGAIHTANAEAGAQVLTTNSFGANPIKLKGHNLAEQTEAINLKAAALAREQAGEELYVAGSVGPLGQRLKPAEAEEAFSRQIKALLAGGVDLILFETFKDTEELLLAVRTARELDAAIPLQAHISFSFENSGSVQGRAREVAAQLNQEKAIDVMGSNCGIGPAQMLDVLKIMKEEGEKPVAIIPDAGIPQEVDGRHLYLASPDYFAEYAIRFQEAGAAAIGGCCGSTPEHIKKMGQAVLNLAAGRKNLLINHEPLEERSQEEVPLAKRSRLGLALSEGRWVSLIEMVPPMGTDLSKLLEKTTALKKGKVEFVNLPDGPRASPRVSVMVTALEMERREGIETIIHVCCRDRNLLALQGDLLGAQVGGLRNMLLITGDPPKVGNYPDVTGVFDVDSVGLLHLGKRLNRGIDLGGHSLPNTTSLVLGAGVNPASPTPEQEIDRTYMKAEAGADFFITQPVFDAEALLSFLERIRGTEVPVIVGVWPLASYRNALFLNNEVPGVIIPPWVMGRMEKTENKEKARYEGILIAREIIEAVRFDAAGIQVSPPFGNVLTALEVIREV